MSKQSAKSSAYTIKHEGNLFKVFDKDQKFRCSFHTEIEAKSYIAARECAAHASSKRMTAQALATAMALAVLIWTEGGSGITPPLVRRVCHRHTPTALYHCHIYR